MASVSLMQCDICVCPLKFVNRNSKCGRVGHKSFGARIRKYCIDNMTERMTITLNTTVISVLSLRLSESSIGAIWPGFRFAMTIHMPAAHIIATMGPNITK
jgi:hypothetical protein